VRHEPDPVPAPQLEDRPEPDVDQIEDLEDLPPVADGRHQTTSALGAKAATVGLLTCLALGPVGAVAGGLAFLQPASPSPPRP
jgi:hypothetical protein